MQGKLLPGAEKLMKQLFKDCETKGKDQYIPDIVLKANSLFQQGKYSESLGYYELMVHFSPSEPGTWSNLGNNYLMLKNLPKAFKCFQEAVTLDKNDFNCLVNIGNCYVTWNQPDKAIIYYLRAAIVDMKSIVPFKSLAEIYKQKNHFDTALIFLNQCFFLDQKNVQILTDMAMIYLLQNKFEKGLEFIKRILKIDPKNQMAQMIMFKLKAEGKI